MEKSVDLSAKRRRNTEARSDVVTTQVHEIFAFEPRDWLIRSLSPSTPPKTSTTSSTSFNPPLPLQSRAIQSCILTYTPKKCKRVRSLPYLPHLSLALRLPANPHIALQVAPTSSPPSKNATHTASCGKSRVIARMPSTRLTCVCAEFDWSARGRTARRPRRSARG